MIRIIVVILAAAIPAVMWSLSLLPSWLMVFSLLALFTSLRGLSTKLAFRLGTLYGFVLYGVSLSWLWSIFTAPAIALWLILALFCGISASIIAWSSIRWKQAAWWPLYIAMVWSSVEYFRCEWFTLRFPWITAGTAMGPIGITPWIGVYGASFLVAWLAASMIDLRRPQWRHGNCLLIALLLSVPVRDSDPIDPQNSIPVMAVQSENCDFFTYIERTQQSNFRDGIILWPEYSVFEDVQTNRWGRDHQLGIEPLTALAREKNSLIILGQRRIEGDGAWNEALVIGAEGVIGSHAKNRPVHFMNDGTPGKTALPIVTRFGAIATPICFDNDYTEVPRRMATAGAHVFLAPSMDAEHWSARQHRQHAELFRLRAVETGRWYMVCATSGVTQVISPDGKRRASLPLMQDGVLTSRVGLRVENTPYIRYGWLFPYLVAALTIIGTIVLWTKRRSIPRETR